MKLVALYKTFRGHEFAAASLASIYDHVDAIVAVHSDRPWIGFENYGDVSKGGNTVEPIMRAWAEKNDVDRKIVHVNGSWDSQPKQYDAGVEACLKIGYDWLLLIDSDEVWDADQIRAAKARADELPKTVMALKCNGLPYVKSPFYRVVFRKAFCPSVMLRFGHGPIGTRGMTVSPHVYAPTIYFHHFCSVRETLEDVIGKHRSSCGVENVEMVPEQEWIDTVWNVLPDTKADDILPIKGVEDYWGNVKEVGIEDLPVAVRDMTLVKAFQAYKFRPHIPELKQLVESDEGQDLYRQFGLPRDFGPRHPDFRVPSKRRKWDLLQRALRERVASK